MIGGCEKNEVGFMHAICLALVRFKFFFIATDLSIFIIESPI